MSAVEIESVGMGEEKGRDEKNNINDDSYIGHAVLYIILTVTKT
jgi:hypothetical protein